MSSWNFTPSVEDAQQITERKLLYGSYHAIVDDVSEKTSKKSGNDMIIVDVTTLAGTINECSGLKHSFMFTQNEWAFKDLLRLLLAAELCTQQEITDAAKSNVPIRIGNRLPDLIGKQLCFTLRENTKDPEYPKANYYNVNSEEAKSIPKDLAAAEIAKANAGNAENSVDF